MLRYHSTCSWPWMFHYFKDSSFVFLTALILIKSRTHTVFGFLNRCCDTLLYRVISQTFDTHVASDKELSVGV